MLGHVSLTAPLKDITG
jgi:hypothetical protein